MHCVTSRRVSYCCCAVRRYSCVMFVSSDDMVKLFEQSKRTVEQYRENFLFDTGKIENYFFSFPI
jgi:hypothetical protein